MSEPFRITIYENGHQVHSEEYAEPVELGRQDRDDGEVYSARPKDGLVRIPMARGREAAVSKKQVLVEALPEGRVRLTNQSTGVPIRLVEEQLAMEFAKELGPGRSYEVLLPVKLGVGPREVRIEAGHRGIEAVHLESLAEAPLPPGARTPDHSLLNTIAADRMIEGESLIPWLQAIIDVQGAATLQDCFDRAAGALVDLIGLDSGGVLLFEGSDWVVKALKLAPHRTSQRGVNQQWKPSTQVLTILRQEKRTFWQPPPAHTASTYGVQALVAAPVLDLQGEVIGALYGDRSWGSGGPLAGRTVTRVQAMQVQLLASGVAAALAQRKLMQVEHDLEIGREIQAGFLPRELPQSPGWELAPHFRPAREVSGDFYDAFALPGGHLALVIADVCDKGVGSALYMALFRSLLRAFAEQAITREQLELAGQHSSASGPQATEHPGAVGAELIARSAVERTHKYVYQTHGWQCMFCTVFFGVLDTVSGDLTYINAGHDAPALIGATGVKARLAPTGPAVGFIPNVEFQVNRVLLEPGDILFAYTDGVTDARDPAGQFFTVQRLMTILQQPIPSAVALVDNLSASLQVHIAGAEPYDDVTMLAVRRVP